ncbi:MAG: chemotaxis protein CheB [Alphaproteobacteria bacterium]|nr:chemotaxis protein CheB [Alphaproteobacteria bacterium]
MAKTPAKRTNDQGNENGELAPPSPLIVGIGASAGGLEAFKTFFSLMPTDSGMAFVLIQHLDPNRLSMLVDLLSAATQMPVTEAKDGAQLIANHVYVIPPDATLTVESDVLRVARPAPPRETRRPIDTFFVSLAAAQGDNAVCIILSGGGSDGSIGLTAIKEHGGLTLAQAEFDSHAKLGMPSSAAATGRVDDVLPVEQMPEKLLDYARYLIALRDRIGAGGVLAGDADSLAKICRIVRSVVGHDFSEYKDKTLMRRIQRRMQGARAETMDDYVNYLRKEPREVRSLFQEFLISVTDFFRDPEAFAALVAQALPQIVADKGANDKIRIWVSGCATGEEVYSIAILLKEQLAGKDGAPILQIFATDIDEEAIVHARAGRYRLDQLEGVSPARREKWFVQDNDRWCPAKQLRELCVFSVHNAIKDPPFSKLDLIVCRNLLIYLQPPAQDRLMGVFEYALRPGGYLFLGLSESLARQNKTFSIVDKKNRIFRRRENVLASLPNLPYATAKVASGQIAARSAATPEDRLDIDTRRTMERHFPAYIVVDARNEVVRFSTHVAKYLGPSPGAASLDLFALLQRPLRPPARAALQKAVRGRQSAVQKNISVEIDGATHMIDLLAEPVGGGESGFCVLAFLDRGLAPLASASSHEGVQDLEQELALTRERLQASVDELEVNNEEMKSANEEYQSVNEELQSTNEELETSKEEMQSINEELQTVNAELNAKNDTLLRLNSDLKNFLDSTEIATLFLDSQLRVTNFTPAMTGLFHLRESDYQRPVTEIAPRFEYGDLAHDVAEVLRTLMMVEREVATSAGRVFIMRIRPCRRLDNVIDGVVVTFLDVTDRKQLDAERLLRSEMVVSSGDAIIGLDSKGVILSWNAGAEALCGYANAHATGRHVELIVPADLRSGELDRRTRINRGERVENYDTMGQRRDAGLVDVSVSISPVKDGAGAITGASLIVRNITERVRAKERQALLLLELNHRVKNTLATVQSIASQTLSDEPDPQAFRDAFQKRLAALSRTHNLLSDGDWRGSPLHDVLLAETAPYTNGADRVAIEGPNVKLTPGASLALGMAFHELATNAAKYGGFSVPAGRVQVKWGVENGGGERRLHLEWRESNGPAVTTPKRRGLGSRLIERGLAHQLNGTAELRFESAGVRFILEAPLASIEAAP